MLVQVLDANGQPITRIVPAQGAAVDRSGVIGAPPTVVMVANPNRSGWLYQNTGTGTHFLAEQGGDPTAAGTIQVGVGQSFPPPYFPVPVGAINVTGPLGDTFSAREW